MPIHLSGKLVPHASAERQSFAGCRVEALFDQTSISPPAHSDAEGRFTFVWRDYPEIAGETVRLVALSPSGHVIGETEVPTADLGDEITIEVDGAGYARPRPAAQPEFPGRSAVDAAFRDDAAVRHALTENLKPLQIKSDAIANRVEAAFRNFAPTPLAPEELAARHYVEPGKDIGEVLEKVVTEGARTLGSAGTRRTLTLRDTAELRSLMTDGAGNGGAAEDDVDLHALVNFIDEKNAGGSLVTEPAYTLCRAKLEAESIVAAIDHPPAAGNADGAANGQVAPPASREADELVKDSVNLQMHSATAPEARLDYGLPAIPNSADKDKVQRSIVQTFELRPGASDVTSYHDFHTLQIAFQHVWTRIFDGQLESLGRELYREYVKLKDFSGSAGEDLRVNTVDDLRRLMDEVKKLSQVVGDDIPRDLSGAGVGTRNGTRGSDDYKNIVKDAAGVASGGLTWLLDWALEEFSKAGKKPIIRWDDFPGPWLPRQDKIYVTFVRDVVPAGEVEIVLQTDYASHIKIIEFEPWDPDRSQFVHGPRIDNGGHVEKVTMTLGTSQLDLGVLEFASEESTGVNLGRYVLGNLTERIKDGTRVTFYWRDN
jgi:hypothetical protein